MARKKKDAGGGYSWMDTYGDMVTLLLTFFIMLFSMSTVNEDKWQILVEAFSVTASGAPQQVVIANSSSGTDVMSPTGEEPLNLGDPSAVSDAPIDLAQLYEFLQAYLKKSEAAGEIAENSVTLEKDAMNNVYIRFDNNIFFDGDSHKLRRESYPMLDFLGKCLKSVEDQILTVRVTGHTAEIKGSSVNDWDLSALRSTRIVNYFQTECDLAPSKMLPSGLGKNFPRADNATPEGRAQNRRVEILIIGNDIDNASAEQLREIINKAFSAEIIPDTNGLTGELDSNSTPPASSLPTNSAGQSQANSLPVNSLPVNSVNEPKAPQGNNPANSVLVTTE